MSNRLYDIINTFNKLVAKDEPKQTITESAKPKTKLEETMAKVEEKYMGFKAVEKAAKKGGAKDPAAVAASIGREKYGKEKFQKAAAAGKKMGESAKPDFLDVDKDGNKKEPFKKAVKDKQVKEAAKPDYIDLDKDGDKKEPMKKAAKDAKKVNEAPELVSGQRLGIAGNLTPFYYNAIAKYLKANGLDGVTQFSSEDVDALASKLGVSMDAMADLVGFTEEEFDESAAPGQESWIKKNKERFVKQYGKKKGMEVLYATAWKRSKNESAYDAEVSEEDPVFEGDDYWDFKDLKDTPTSGTRKVAGKRYGGAAQKDDDEEETNDKPAGEKRGRGRPKGSSKKMGAKGPTGKSKLMKEQDVSEDTYKPDEVSDMVKLAKVIASCQNAEQLKVAQRMADRFLKKHAYGGPMSKLGHDVNLRRDVATDIKSKAKSFTESAAEGEDLVKLAKVIASCENSQQLASAKKMAHNFLEKHRSGPVDDTTMGIARDLDKDFDSKERSFTNEGDYGWDYPEEKSSPSSRKVAGTRYGGSAQQDDDEEVAAEPVKRGRGRPAGTGKKMGAKLPGSRRSVKESRPSLMDRLLDETYAHFGEDATDLTLDQDQLRQHIGDQSFEQLRQAMQTTGEFPESMYDQLYDYFSETGEMPYGAATAEDEDPYNWIHQKLDQIFGADTGGEDYGTFGDDERPEEDEMNAESVNESKQMVAESMQQIVHSYPHEIKRFVNTGEMDNDLYSALFDYYFSAGEMPYGTAKGRDGDPMEWVSMRFDQDVQDLQLEEDTPDFMRRPAAATIPTAAPAPSTGPVDDGLGAELNELARLAGLKESCGESSPLTQQSQSGMSINTNVDTRTGTKTMTVTADGEVADKLAEILSLSGLATQVTARSSEVVGQDVAQEPEMEVVAVGETKDERYHASTTPEPEQADVDAIIDQGDDLHRKKKQHADKPKLGDNPLATENFGMGRSLMRELESIKIRK